MRGHIYVQEEELNQEIGCMCLRIALPESVPHEHPVQHFLNASPQFHRIYWGNGNIKGGGNHLEFSLGAGTSPMSGRGSGLGLVFLQLL